MYLLSIYLQEAVAELQHMSSRKLKRPDTNCRRNMAMVASPSQLWMLYRWGMGGWWRAW